MRMITLSNNANDDNDNNLHDHCWKDVNDDNNDDNNNTDHDTKRNNY